MDVLGSRLLWSLIFPVRGVRSVRTRATARGCTWVEWSEGVNNRHEIIRMN